MAHLNKVIFAIDNNTDTHRVAKFLRYMDTVRAMRKMNGTLTHCIGCWEGILEPSYMMDEIDFDKFVKGSGYIEDQECVLHVPGDTRQPCTLVYPNGVTHNVGTMREAPASEALQATGWTYVQATGKYFVTQ